MLYKTWSNVCLLLTALILSACAATPPATSAIQAGPVCIFGPLTLDSRFPGGRLSACEQRPDGTIVLRIAPENEPINPSPWYAFDFVCPDCAPVSLELVYHNAEHRYPPLARPANSDGGEWPLAVDAEGNRFVIRQSETPLRISAQPFYGVAQHMRWLNNMADQTNEHVMEIGRSHDGVPILALQIGASRPGLLMLGGQHPPETRGAYAFAAFAERLLANDSLATTWREAFGLTLVPALNPDGLNRGNWRHNAEGVDLNRDWGDFTQPETRAVLGLVAEAGPPLAMIDFHGTQRDVLYTLPDNAAGRWPDFAPRLHAELTSRIGETAPARSASHRANSSVSKGWFHDTYQIPTLTYEVGDATPLEHIQAVARVAAEVVMEIMLDDQRSAN